MWLFWFKMTKFVSIAVSDDFGCSCQLFLYSVKSLLWFIFCIFVAGVFKATLRQEGLLTKTRRLRPFHSEVQLDDKSHSLPLSREELRNNFNPSASGDAAFHSGQQRHDYGQEPNAIDSRIVKNHNLRLPRPVTRGNAFSVSFILFVRATKLCAHTGKEKKRRTKKTVNWQH